MIDIEFMVQYWFLWRAHQHPDLTRQRGTIPILEALADAGLLDAGTAQILVDAYRRYLSLEHRFKLMERQALVAPDELGDYPGKVATIWEQQLSSKLQVARKTLLLATCYLLLILGEYYHVHHG